ncbi:FtsX-like permease family protein [Blautia sp. Marseille-P3201T]|uniref:FtsX-like permease family protein n=1 Tax=Blautia sp. Marseille-P3201T TaxID=1907659 RepID=UPI0009306CF7|nr:ABC transporter permease [Blautia sp. Marseille-P3201T]
MFYNLIKRNSKSDRKENSLYFASLIISVVAFYVILSIENQDVMKFIKSMESDAVQKLLILIPIFYVFSLFVLSFLVFFTTRYQMERRSHEFGLYLMMGMKRSRLFFMLIAEDMVNTAVAFLAGFPIAILLTEIISLTVSRLIGLGILEHHFTITWTAVLWTIVGIVLIKIVILSVLSGITVNKEPYVLIKNSDESEKKRTKGQGSPVFLLGGFLLLGIAYFLGVRKGLWEQMRSLLWILLFGITGTYLLFKGFYFLFQKALKKKRKGLRTFTLRQLQESVFLKSGFLASCSLLLLIAFCCLSFGISATFSQKPERFTDFTFVGEEQEVKEKLEQAGIMEQFQNFYQMELSFLSTFEGEHTFSCEELLKAIKELPPSENRDILINNLGYLDAPYIIKLSSYNQLLKSAGKEPLVLKEDEVFLYEDPRMSEEYVETLQEALKTGVHLQIDGQDYLMKEKVMSYDVVTDDKITLMDALIVEDSVFEILCEKDSTQSYWNAILNDKIIENEGLIKGFTDINKELAKTGLEYESYMENMGRHLFYIVSESYLSIYLGVVFLIIANTAIGTQFLMYQGKTGKRYQALFALGADFSKASKSGRTQVCWYFFLPAGVAAVSSVFGIQSMTNGLLSSYFEEQQSNIIVIALLVVCLIAVVEWVYIRTVMKNSDRNIHALLERKRDE